MTDLELIFSMLGEASTTEIARNRDAQGFPQNKQAARAGGTVADNARRELEQKRDRTYDQMVQAARSGKQNILEASQASGTSKETEIKLTNVARASLEELLEDYRDHLRVRQLRLWDKDSKEALLVRKLGATKDASYETYRTYLETRPPEIVANILICLIHQTNYLLDQQLRRLEETFVKEGGLRERMTRPRLAERDRQRKEEP